MGDKMKILVTGGAGFIGSNFTRFMLSNYAEAEIVNLDLLTYAGRIENIGDLLGHPRYRFVRGDIRDGNITRQVSEEGYDAVVNFAAETHVDRSILDAEPFITTDVLGTYTLLKTFRDSDLDMFVQISTDEVYGNVSQGRSAETDILRPSNPYSASKSAGDLMALAFHRTFDFPVSITRSSNSFGPYQHPEKLIPKMTIRALRNEKLTLYGDGTQIRDWVYVIDNCRAIDTVLNKGKPGEVYNIGSGREHANIDVAKLILGILEKPESSISLVADRPGHDQRYAMDTSKIERLGWHPSFTFEEALKYTVEWFTTNESWWTPVLDDNFVQSDTPWLQPPHR